MVLNHIGTIYGYNFDSLYYNLLSALTKYPQYICKPRGSLIKESLAVTLVLHNPRSRLLTCNSRATNYGFAVGEFLWYWSGKQDLETMLYYNKRMKNFSNDGKTLNSAYGYRLRQKYFFAANTNGTGETQWETCKKTLLDDPDSRRAVMLINLPEDEREAVVIGSKDVPCTLSLQFFVRENKLDLHVLMRSNDVIWGLTYDLFSFTLLQECMLLELQKYPQFANLRLGSYYHTAGSMHLYETHFKQAEQIVDEYSKMNAVDLIGPRCVMEPITSLVGLETICSLEEKLRKKEIDHIDYSEWSGSLAWMVDQLNVHRMKRDAEEAK